MDSKKAINDFISYLKRKKKSKSTLIAYKKDLEQISESNIKKSIADFTETDLRHALKYLTNIYTISPKTLSRKINSLRTFYRYLLEKKVIKLNPALNIQHPKYRIKKQRILSKQEYLALRETSRDNNRLFLITELLLQTGIRIGELSRLKKSDVTIKGKKSSIKIGQFASNDERTVPLNYKMREYLDKYLKEDNRKKDAPLFYTKTGKAIEVRNIRSSIDRAIIKARIKNACVNDLRNTFIVYQLNSGASIDFIAEIVGHKNIATTTRYIELLSKKYRALGINEVVEL